MPDFDLAIVGAGPGGYVAAIRAAQLGLKTALIEKAAVGGVCLNWGCIPSKALLHGAELANVVRHASAYGIGYDNVTLDFGIAVSRSRDVVAKIVAGVETLLKANAVHLMRGTARLESPTRLCLTPGDRTIAATNVILATGAATRTLPNAQIDGVRVLTSREALEMRETPRSIIIVGAGPVGVEFAYIFRSYGADVTVVEALAHALPAEDEELGRGIERALTAQGVDLRTGTRVEGIDINAIGVTVTVSADDKREELRAERVLIATGFQPNTDGLGLSEAGVGLDQGWVKIDDRCRTNQPGLWAIGDVTGRLLLAHVAMAQGVTAVETIAGVDTPPLDYNQMPRAVFCQPQVGALGLTEEQARLQGRKVRVGRFPFRANGKALAIGETDGFVKLVVDEDTQRVLGYHILGLRATELIGEASLGAVLETTPRELGFAIHAHPTLSEAIKEAALAVNGEAVHFYSQAPA